MTEKPKAVEADFFNRERREDLVGGVFIRSGFYVEISQPLLEGGAGRGWLKESSLWGQRRIRFTPIPEPQRAHDSLV